jgi:hypothetical protein
MSNKHLNNLNQITEVLGRLGNLENLTEEDLDKFKEDITLLANKLSKEYGYKQDSTKTDS